MHMFCVIKEFAQPRDFAVYSHEPVPYCELRIQAVVQCSLIPLQVYSYMAHYITVLLSIRVLIMPLKTSLPPYTLQEL